MKFDLEKMKDKGIHCNTKEKSKELLKFLSENSYKWGSNVEIGKETDDKWLYYRENTVYHISNNKVFAGSILNCNDDEVLKFEDVIRPRICEILGVEVNELFELRTSGQNIPLEFKYYITEDGRFMSENNYNSPTLGLNVINGKVKIVKLPKWTEEQKEIFKALKTLGYNYIARDSDYSIYAFEKKPVTKLKYYWSSEGIVSFELGTDKIMNKSLLNFIKWEDKEPFEIPEVSLHG